MTLLSVHSHVAPFYILLLVSMDCQPSLLDLIMQVLVVVHSPVHAWSCFRSGGDQQNRSCH